MAAGFEGGLEEWLDEVMDEADVLVRAVNLEALRGVVLMTPVDTGRARGNWQVGPPEPAELDVLDPTGSLALATGSQEIAKAPRFGLLWISNGLVYIVPLEDGHSGQAPRGMVTVTVERLKAMVRSDAIPE